jgi:hypothetical protein
MKKVLLISVLFSLTLMAKSQDVSVEQSVSGIQLGIYGIWAHKESKLTNQLVLRGEIGFNSGFWGGRIHDKTGFVMTPVIIAEPRWYYNLNKRKNKSRRIDGNSGNFLSIRTSYHPDWFIISNYDNAEVISNISIMPTWGIRRNIGKHFNYEAGVGIGYQYFFSKQAGYVENEGETEINLHLRIGYRF